MPVPSEQSDIERAARRLLAAIDSSYVLQDEKLFPATHTLKINAEELRAALEDSRS